jgi:CheY-like chemotaxis protein
MTAHAILVVDDNRDLCETLVSILEDHGFSASTAGNGLEALKALQGGLTPCLVLLDLMMPVMDGYTFLERRRRDPRLSSIPVVIITAGAHIDQERARDARILAKPIRTEALMAIVREIC